MMVNLPSCLLVAALTLAARAVAAVKGGEEELWAVELLSTNEAVARSVAADLGMVVTGRVFSNVFLMKGGGGHNSVLRRPNKEWLQHRLVVWSERQVGRRRSSRRKIDPVRTDTKDMNRGRGGADNVWAEQFSGRFMRDVGGLNKERPKSPWDLLVSKDPLRWRQWYLEAGGGMHLNVTGLWEAGIKGGGVSVAVLDDGVELTHLDLALNYDPAASWDLLDADPDPTPVPWSRHGTQMAGIIAATHNNGLCGMGVAPWSGVGAVRMLGYLVWDAIEAKALGYEREHVDVYVAAWGPVDTGTVMEGPGVLAARALAEGIVLGRGGRGSIYIWASGNGGFVGDDCNADGYSNSVYTLTVSGSTRGGHPPEYAETCAAAFVSTYSGDADKINDQEEKNEEEEENEEEEDEEEEEEQVSGIVTTDTGGVCTESFRGSSVSAAMVAGVCALAIDMNPELTWRDMQHLMLRAAAPHNPVPSQWSTNGVGAKFSHYFGFGSLDAGKMVGLARDWKTVPPAFQCRLHASLHDLPLVSSQRLVLPLSVRGCQVVQTEHVQVNLSVSARTRGQVEVVLESPMGTKSTLLPQRPLDLSPYGIYNHPLMTVHMWGEDPRGTWKLHFIYHGDGVLEPFGGKRFVNLTNTLHNWTLTIHGTEVAVGQVTPHHYYYNASQLASLQHKDNDTTAQLEDDIKLKNPTEEGQEVTVETQYWNSRALSGGKILSYLFCFVRVAIPSVFNSVMWQKSDGTPVDKVVRRLNGRDALAARYPSMLVVREVETPDGNFTCHVRHRGQNLIRITEVRGHQDSVPEVTEVTRVSVRGGTVVLPCPGLVPILRPTWVFQGRRLRPSRRVVVGEQEVTIRGVTENDYGVYRCQVKSARLHYTHTTVVTLLPARGPTTLIAHYALTAYPEPPPTKVPSCSQNSSEENQNETIVVAEEEDNTTCPAPYKVVQGHCVLVAPGEPRSWQKARSQCQRFNGDLLVVENAALLLALMRLFHSQGLANSSFWVGGGRRSGEWRWVNGAPVTPGGPLWYPTPSGGPKELRPRHHRMFAHARGSEGPQRGEQSMFRQFKKKSSFQRETQSHVPTTRPQGIPGSSQREGSIPPHTSRDSQQRPWLFQSFVEESRAAITPVPEVRQGSAPGTRSGRARSSEVARREATGRRKDKVASRRVNQNRRNRTLVPANRGSDQEELAADAPSNSAKTRFKATCLRARLRHFLSSCWAGIRLRALCQYQPGESPAEERDPS